MDPENPQRQHYSALDGLRGLAILLVVIYHNFGFINVFFFGWLGVDLFFVLSGFLITDILLNALGKPNYLRNFYMRRVLRIFPLYYLCLVIFLLILPLFPGHKAALGYYSDNQVWLWTYLQNWLYIFKPTSSTDILHHFWSLAVEEQFYLLWPLTILLIRKPRFLIMLLAVILLSVISLRFILWTYKIESLAYFNLYTFSRVDGICIGSMLALIQRINTNILRKYTTFIVLGLAGMNFLFYFFNRYYNFSFPYLAIVGYTTFAIMFALLVYEGIDGRNKIINFLFNNGLMKFFGKISYGLYVYHWPIYILASGIIAEWVGNALPFLPARISASFITALIAVGISVLSFKYFESYFIGLKNKYKN